MRKLKIRGVEVKTDGDKYYLTILKPLNGKFSLSDKLRAKGKTIIVAVPDAPDQIIRSTDQPIFKQEI